MLQLLRAAETQTDGFEAFDEEERADDRDADLSAAAQEVAAAAAGGDVGEQDDDTTQQLRTSKRGVTVSLAAVAERPRLAGLASAFGLPPTFTAVMVNTIIKHAVFEWGAPSERQHVRGSMKVRGVPWFSHIRYKDAEGETQWGMVKVELRAVAGVRRPCVVVQCLRRANAHRGCLLTKMVASGWSGTSCRPTTSGRAVRQWSYPRYSAWSRSISTGEILWESTTSWPCPPPSRGRRRSAGPRGSSRTRSTPGLRARSGTSDLPVLRIGSSFLSPTGFLRE